MYGMKNSDYDLSKYDTTVAGKVNFAKANRLDYIIVVQGQKPVDKKTGRLTIIVTKEGKFVKSYYG